MVNVRASSKSFVGEAALNTDDDEAKGVVDDFVIAVAIIDERLVASLFGRAATVETPEAGRAMDVSATP